MSKSPAPILQHALLSWFRRDPRDLPWRRTKDPYKIWVSEIMLQQTQVVTVIPYYQRWIKRFPNLESLAKTPLSEVMKYWAGLGYYRRVRMLHEGAKKIVKELGGILPSEVHDLMKLPGIGRYTAGAITSIAFNKKAPILDGNVIRILARIFAINKDIQKPETKKQLWKISESLVPAADPGAFNEAMMELGATVCLPENPACGKCPVSKLCQAHLTERETAYPVSKKNNHLEKISNVALVIKQDGKVLVQKQPKEGRWGGLWMFPFWKDKPSMLAATGLKNEDMKHLMSIKHGFTKYQVTLEVYEPKQILDTRCEMLDKAKIRDKNKIRDTRYKMLKKIKTQDTKFKIRDNKEHHSFASRISHLGSAFPLESQILDLGSRTPHSRWYPTDKLANLALPSPHKKIAAKLLSSI